MIPEALRRHVVKVTVLTVLGAWALVFGIGFLAAEREHAGLVPAALVIGLSGCILGMAGRGGWPLAGAVTLGMTGWAITLYGSYVAHILGWRGLQESDFGSDDLKGHLYIWAPVFVCYPPLMPFVGYWIGTELGGRALERLGHSTGVANGADEVRRNENSAGSQQDPRR